MARAGEGGTKEEGGPSPAYRCYVLGLFTLVYALNFVDRQIVTILAPYLKADLALTDAQVGLLFGTAFALFYTLGGLPLARLADGWHRVGTLSLGLAFWSAMTALSGTATGFAQLALARVGVGVGEASASPAAYSVLQDYFPRARRATAIAIYMSGIYVGAGASLMIGGGIVAAWDGAFPGGDAPWGLKGWQAAYLAVGLPGILLALLAWATVREPVRGAIDGTPQAPEAHPFRAAAAVAATLFPPFSVLASARRLRNLAQLAACAAAAMALTRLTDGLLAPTKRAPIASVGGLEITTNLVQWCAIGFGVYATLSWTAALRRRDPVGARLMLSSPSFVALAVAGGLVSFGSYGLSAFIFLYGKDALGMDAADGFTLGAIAAAAGGSGTVLGGLLSDAARRRHPAGRLYLVAAALTASGLCSVAQYSVASETGFYVANALALMTLTMWLGPIAATCQDHVPPRLRGTATAAQYLGINLIGLGLGPYMVGLVSDATGDLRLAILLALAPLPLAIALILYAARHLPAAEARVRDVAAGPEPLGA